MVVGLLLAAGVGRRFGGPKAPHIYHGERLVDRGVRLLKEAGCDTIVVVLGAWVGEVPDATVIVNREWERGQASSLLCGLEAIPESAEQICILLVDQIGMTSGAISRVINSSESLAAASVDAIFSPPVSLKREHFDTLHSDLSDALMDSERSDQGAKHYFLSIGGALIPIDDVASLEDLDENPAT